MIPDRLYEEHATQPQDQNITYKIVHPMQIGNLRSSILNDGIPQIGTSLQNVPIDENSVIGGTPVIFHSTPQLLMPSSGITMSPKMYLADGTCQELVLVPKSCFQEMVTMGQKIDFSDSGSRMETPCIDNESSEDKRQSLRMFPYRFPDSSPLTSQEGIFFDSIKDDEERLKNAGNPNLSSSKGKGSFNKRKRISTTAIKKGSKKRNNKSKKYDNRKSANAQHAEKHNEKIARCKVCGNKATKHVHYGGRSCGSCRAFFRRSVIKYYR